MAAFQQFIELLLAKANAYFETLPQPLVFDATKFYPWFKEELKPGVMAYGCLVHIVNQPVNIDKNLVEELAKTQPELLDQGYNNVLVAVTNDHILDAHRFILNFTF